MRRVYCATLVAFAMLAGTFGVHADVVTITLSGTNTFNSDETSGFFDVDFTSGAGSIEYIEFDAVALGSGLVFDTDQTGMANPAGPAPQPTSGPLIRPSVAGVPTSSLADAIGGLAWATSDGNADGRHDGMVFTNEGTVNSFGTMLIPFDISAFTSGLDFEFDVDTDSGPGINGDAVGSALTFNMKFHGDATIYSGRFSTLVAGQSSQLTINTVPEPAAAGLCVMVAAVAFCRRRRSG